MMLDNTGKDYRPIVQVIDNIERNHKLGLIFEFAVGKGKLLVSMADRVRHPILKVAPSIAAYWNIWSPMTLPLRRTSH